MPQTPEERKAKAKWARIRRVYGITEDQYNSLLGTACRICQNPFSPSRPPVVDHNHHSGEIRGIICRTCNHRVVGRHTDADLLQRVTDYVRGPHTGWIVPPKPKRKRKKRRT